MFVNMDIKNIYERAIYYVTVPKCICCNEILDFGDKALCKSCYSEYINIKLQKCSYCNKFYDHCLCSNDYLLNRSVKKLCKIYRYRPPSSANDKIPSNELIYHIKRGYRRDIIDFLSSEMADVISTSFKYENYIITSVPRSLKRKIQYGIDHSRKVAEAVAKKLDIPYQQFLVSKSKKAQKKTHGDERFKNIAFDYKHDADLSGQRIILFDDIVTTGASMGGCAVLLKGLGAKEIVGASISIAFKDKYVPFSDEDRFTKKK